MLAMMSVCHKKRILIGVLALAGILIVLGCSGPQPLKVAIRMDDQRQYGLALQEHPASPRDAWYELKAQESGRSVVEIAESDQALSTTKNPFDANNDPKAVSMGAVMYQQHCLSCHGQKARGRGEAMSVELPRMDFHDFGHRFAVTLHRGAPRSWFRKINEGYQSEVVNEDGSTNVMPAHQDILAREQIWLAITYLQSLDAYAPSPSK